nr:MAG TPA: hypothetical protein [Bacteriophage sp.]
MREGSNGSFRLGLRTAAVEAHVPVFPLNQRCYSGSRMEELCHKEQTFTKY